MSIWEYIVLFGCVLLGGGIALYLGVKQKNWLKLVLSFSGAYILGIAVLHLMPGVFFEAEHKIGIWIMIGFFIQLLLEQLSRGIEHGHIHLHQEKHPYRYALQVMTGLSLHAFMEGLPLSGYEHFHGLYHGHEHNYNHLLYGVIIHKMPAAFALTGLLMMSGFKRVNLILCLLVFASMSPLGALTASIFAFDPKILRIIIAIIVGSFLHISTTILFEADDTHQHRISWKKLLIILAGIGLALLTAE